METRSYVVVVFALAIAFSFAAFATFINLYEPVVAPALLFLLIGFRQRRLRLKLLTLCVIAVAALLTEYALHVRDVGEVMPLLAFGVAVPIVRILRP